MLRAQRTRWRLERKEVIRIVEAPVSERAPNAMAATYEDACRRLSCSSSPCLMSDTAKRSRSAAIRSADGSWRPDSSTAGVDHESMDRSSVRTSFSTTLPKIPPICIMMSG